jgi:hypothetical protein
MVITKIIKRNYLIKQKKMIKLNIGCATRTGSSEWGPGRENQACGEFDCTTSGQQLPDDRLQELVANSRATDSEQRAKPVKPIAAKSDAAAATFLRLPPSCRQVQACQQLRRQPGQRGRGRGRRAMRASRSGRTVRVAVAAAFSKWSLVPPWKVRAEQPALARW